MEVRTYIENQMLNDTAWADRDADRVPMEDDPFIDWEADIFEEYGASYDYYED